MDERSELNQSKTKAGEVSFGEPRFTAYPYVRQFSQSVLSAEAWFHTAEELIAAMDLVEPNVERFWEDVRSIAVALIRRARCHRSIRTAMQHQRMRRAMWHQSTV